MSPHLEVAALAVGTTLACGVLAREVGRLERAVDVLRGRIARLEVREAQGVPRGLPPFPG